MKKFFSALSAIAYGCIGSILITIACFIGCLIFGGIWMWRENHAFANSAIGFVGFFLGSLGKILGLASLPGIIIFGLSLCTAPASGAGIYCNKSFKRARDNGVFATMPRGLSASCGVISFAIILLLWELSRRAGILTPDLRANGAFYNDSFVMFFVVIGFAIAAWFGYRNDLD